MAPEILDNDPIDSVEHSHFETLGSVLPAPEQVQTPLDLRNAGESEGDTNRLG